MHEIYEIPINSTNTNAINILAYPPTHTFPLKGGSYEKVNLFLFHVIPAKAGIQCFQGLTKLLDPGFHRGDE
jgi:hypothetical protein